MATKKMRQGIFISYSHKDKVWLEKLQTILKPLVRNESLRLWDDTAIKPGAVWRQDIKAAISTARVAILLVSPNFLASDFIAQVELPAVFKLQQKKGLIILWIAVSASAYQFTELAKLQAANDPQRPLDTLSKAEQNKALVKIAEKIAAAVDINAVANVFSMVDDFAPQAEAFVQGRKEPTRPVRHRVVARQEKDVIRFESLGQTVEMVTSDDLKKLDSGSQQLIRANESAMRDLFDRWTELQPKRFSRDPEVRRRARTESEEVRRDLCDVLNQILNFMDFLGKSLSDHYQHVRYICQQLPATN